MCNKDRIKSVSTNKKHVILGTCLLHLEEELQYFRQKLQSIYQLITNFPCDELIMKIMQSSFIHRFAHFTHK